MLLFLLVLQSSFGISQLSQDEFYPIPKDYKPPVWDRYPLNPQPYPKYGKPPSDVWPPPRTQNYWKIDALSLTRLNTKNIPAMTATFSIYRSSWEPCSEDVVLPIYVPCGWITSDQHLNCSSEGDSTSTSKWFSCQPNTYSQCTHESVEKDMQWIKWRVFDLEEKNNTGAFSQVKMQFIHGVPVLQYVHMWKCWAPK